MVLKGGSDPFGHHARTIKKQMNRAGQEKEKEELFNGRCLEILSILILNEISIN